MQPASVVRPCFLLWYPVPVYHTPVSHFIISSMACLGKGISEIIMAFEKPFLISRDICLVEKSLIRSAEICRFECYFSCSRRRNYFSIRHFFFLSKMYLTL